MNRELLNLQRDIVEGTPHGCTPYDHYTYNAFSWQAQHLSYRAKTEEERQLCMFLKEMAAEKAKRLREEVAE